MDKKKVAIGAGIGLAAAGAAVIAAKKIKDKKNGTCKKDEVKENKKIKEK